MGVFSGHAGVTDIQVRAQPRASRSEIVGPHGNALKVRIAAPPVEGAANLELEKVLAKALGLPRSSVQVVRGASGRNKLVRVTGLGPDDVRRRLAL